MSDTQKLRQGAVIGGWLCFITGMTVMYFSLWTFILYIPLFAVAFILSTVAMSQRRILGGFVLLLITIAAPLAVWFVLAGQRIEEHAKTHPSPLFEAGKEVGREIGHGLLGTGDESKSADAETPDARVEASSGPRHRGQSLNDQDTPKTHNSHSTPPSLASPKAIIIDGDTVPLVYEIKATAPTSHEAIANFVQGSDYRRMDEFSRREFLEKLRRFIAERTAEVNPDTQFSVEGNMLLGEYDFDRGGFPLVSVTTGKPIPEISSLIEGRPGWKESGLAYQTIITNSAGSSFARIELAEAKSLGPALRTSRLVSVTFTGKLDHCAEWKQPDEPTAIPVKQIHLRIMEVRVVLNSGGQTFTFEAQESTNANSDAGQVAGKNPATTGEPGETQGRAKETGTNPAGIQSKGEEPPPVPKAAPVTEPIKPIKVSGVPEGDSLSVRSEPSMKATTAFTLKNGQEVQIRGDSVMNGETEWVPITVDTKHGWVTRKFLKEDTK